MNVERSHGVRSQRPTPDFFCQIHRQVILEASGELDLATRDELRSALEEALTYNKGSQIELDFAAVTFADCAGLGPIFDATAILADRGESLRICAISAPVERLLSLVGIPQGLELS